MKRYNTKQRERLLGFFTANPGGQFTIEQLQSEIDGISLSSIYRNVGELVKSGTVRRFQDECLRSTCYQYIGQSDCREHLHLKCSRCGCIIHTDARSAFEISNAVRSCVDFELDKSSTILLGECGGCIGNL